MRRLKFSLPQYTYIFYIHMYYLLKMNEVLNFKVNPGIHLLPLAHTQEADDCP